MTECVGPRCSARAVQQHHVIYAQELRRAGASLHDERFLIGLCVRCHERHHSGVARLPLWALPDSVFGAAAEVLGAGPAYEYLGRRYVGGDPRHDALIQ